MMYKIKSRFLLIHRLIYNANMPAIFKLLQNDDKFYIYHIFAQIIIMGTDSNEYPQSMLKSQNKKIMSKSLLLQFYYRKWSVRGLHYTDMLHVVCCMTCVPVLNHSLRRNSMLCFAYN